MIRKASQLKDRGRPRKNVAVVGKTCVVEPRITERGDKMQIEHSLENTTHLLASIYSENMFSEARNFQISGGAFTVQMLGTTLGEVYQGEISN